MIFRSNAATRAAMRGLVATRGDALARGGFKVGALLGCGRQGCAAKSTTGRVVKLTVFEPEVVFSRWLTTFGRALPSMLPRIYRIGAMQHSMIDETRGRRQLVSEAVFAVEREDLVDPPWESGPVQLLQVVGAAMQQLGQIDIAFARGADPDVLLLEQRNVFAALEVLSDGEWPSWLGDDPLPVAPEVREAAQDAVKLRVWQEQFNVVIYDLAPRNWGWRAPAGGLFSRGIGQLVIRDIGLVKFPREFEFGRAGGVEIAELRGLTAKRRGSPVLLRGSAR